ncbi:hypothetical protein DYI24_26330 [Rhodopseudomonas sp. BR0C11]|jgi:predicted RNase H-like nuclease (RuvC/YqgF family)|uniref:hypothetical protein n=1 Tax=Rhodopseudomonas sp. BR0C11 TaxID=2269370 RepID=UPI0013E05191|nr:hypothetical protein [Rhodopseudomonas sp. BR0C11]NEV80555.1 hypothetical protein [Rhodopseudomonas sp. BR0C11]
MLEFIERPEFVGPVCAAIGVGLTVGGNVLINRFKTSAAVAIAREKSEPNVQTAISEAVAGLVKHYTQALAEQTAEVRELRNEIAELRRTVESQNEEIAELNREISGLNDHIDALSSELKKHGIEPPARPDVPVNA